MSLRLKCCKRVISNTLANWYSPFTYIGPDIAYFGESATGYLNPGHDNPGANVFAPGPTPNGLPIYNLNMQLYLLPIPEPGVLGLVGISGLSLLLLRRLRR